MGRGAKSAKPKAEARPTVTRKSRKVDGSTGLQLKQRLAEALEQHAAVSEILQVISASPSDVQPVLNAVAERAARLCQAPLARVLLVDGDVLRAMAEYSLDGTSQARTAPLPLRRSTITGRAVLDRTTIHHDDVVPLLETEYPDALNARTLGLRAVLAVPLMRGGDACGAVLLFRREPRPFSPAQVELVQTFARQAAIAIENARLFNETKEALEQQRASGEVLAAISSSIADTVPVFERILESCEHLFAGKLVGIGVVGEDRLLRLAAYHGPGRDEIDKTFPAPIDDQTAAGVVMIRGEVLHLPDADVGTQVPPATRRHCQAMGIKAAVVAPMLWEGKCLGSIFVGRDYAGPFSDKEIALLKTFADQAAIAIENVRLFNETKEALERQTATSEILQVISASPSDVQPVLDAVAERALNLCDAAQAGIFLVEEDTLRFAARFGNMLSPEENDSFPLNRALVVGRAVIDRETIHHADIVPLLDTEYPDARLPQQKFGFRALLGVPLMREDRAIGAIALWRMEARRFTDRQIALVKTFAGQAAIAIENVRLFTETKEALERQTATSEILRVISQSPMSVQPVFDTIVGATLRLCSARSANLFTFDGQLLHLAAHARPPGGQDDSVAVDSLAMHRNFPRPPSRELAAPRAVLTRAVVSIPDVLADTEYTFKEAALAGGFRSVLAVPLIREGSPIGAIVVGRPEPGPFPETQIALLKTFADQGVIAIENVRLFNETKEALEQQTATSEILRVISNSPTRLEPVLEAVVSAAARFCGAPNVVILRIDGSVLRGGTGVGQFAEIIKQRAGSFSALEIPITRESVAGRAVFDRRTVHVHDLASENEDEYPIGRQLQGRFGHHTTLATPLLREGVPLGVILLFRMEVNPFSEKQIELLRTFADQAVIAIENVRLFTELEARTGELTRSVSELKALGEVGQAVSSTLDLETVLSTIVSRAAQLAGMDGGSIWEYDETREEFYLHATDRLPDELVEALRTAPIRKGEGALGRLAMTGEPVQIRDIAEELNYPSRLLEVVMRSGYRSVLAVPLLREDHLLGALAVNRNSAGEFAPEVIALLKTFATQSALAIQNARLFREVEVKSRELETASRHKSEFLANMSHELRTPLNAIIGFSEVLSERLFGEINEKQAEYIGDILQSGQHLLSLINDILDLSKIEAGRMELEPTDFDLPTAIESTLVLVRERAHRRGITLERMVDERVGMINADERKVKQVLLNLLSNALKFTPEGGRIDVRAAVCDGTAEISVTDTGVGIAPEDQEKVFEEFRQVGTASKKVEGTGLGLAISRKFIELHGGRIWVESQVGAGSTFTFTLPLTND